MITMTALKEYDYSGNGRDNENEYNNSKVTKTSAMLTTVHVLATLKPHQQQHVRGYAA